MFNKDLQNVSQQLGQVVAAMCEDDFSGNVVVEVDIKIGAGSVHRVGCAYSVKLNDVKKDRS